MSVGKVYRQAAPSCRLRIIEMSLLLELSRGGSELPLLPAEGWRFLSLVGREGTAEQWAWAGGQAAAAPEPLEVGVSHGAPGSVLPCSPVRVPPCPRPVSSANPVSALNLKLLFAVREPQKTGSGGKAGFTPEGGVTSRPGPGVGGLIEQAVIGVLFVICFQETVPNLCFSRVLTEGWPWPWVIPGDTVLT